MSNRIQILNATADDFAMEVVSTVPVNGSVGDHANGRLVKYGTHMYVWCNHQGIWAKFANVSDFTSLETRLSQQEDANDADVLSLEGIDSSLETRISEEESAMLSAIASEEARASSQEDSIETRISSMISARVEDVSSEASLQESLVTSVNIEISTIIAARISAVDSLEARATAAETSLESRLSNEEDAKDAGDLSLTQRLSSEEAQRLASDSSLSSAIAAESGSRTSADSSLETAISTEEARISAILHASTADKDSFAEIVTHINAIDLAHDTQTSTEIASLAADIASMESSLEGIDNSVETRLSNEEDEMSSKDSSLEVRIATEEGATVTSDTSLATRLSSEESTRLATDNSIGGRLGTDELARANADTSLDTRLSNEEDTMSAGDLSLETLLSGDSADKTSADSSIETRIADEESAMLSAVASEQAERVTADSSVESLVSTEEVAREDGDVSLETNMQTNETIRALADSSLESRLSNEEDNFSTDKSSIETRLSIEEDAMSAEDSSVETRFSNEISTEKSRIDEILDSADADKDTFVELVSFITEFDVDADDALSSYQLVIDSRISAEESNMSAGDSSLATELAAKIVERQSAVTSLENKHSGEISTLGSSVDSLETREEARHLRVDFSNKTSFTVLQTDLPSGFTPGNGLVQIYQEVSSNTYRRLVSPMNFDPTTGEMTFDLGVSAKSGFAVFYSFAGDETDMSSSSGQQASPPPPSSGSSSYPQFKITGASASWGANAGDSSSVTVNVTGVTASNVDSFLNYTGDTFYLSVYGQTTYSYYDIAISRRGVSFVWASDYSSFTINYENLSNQTSYRTTTTAPSGSAYQTSLLFGTSADSAYFRATLYFDSVSGALVPYPSSAGEVLDSGDDIILSPPYMSGTGTATYTATVNQGSYVYRGGRNYRTRALRGPEWGFDLTDLTGDTGGNRPVRNWSYKIGAHTTTAGQIRWEAQNIFDSTTDGAWAVHVTSGGTDYYSTGSAISSSHHLWSEITTNRTQSNVINRFSANVHDSISATETLKLGWSDRTSSTQVNPDADTIVTMYLASHGATGQHLINDTHYASPHTTYNWGANTSYATDIKIVIDTSDQSYEIYRNSNVGGSPTWVAVDRAYLSNQEVN